MLPKKRLVELLVTFFRSFLMLKKKGIISTCFKFSADLPRKSWEITFSACRSGNRSLNACLRYIFHFLRKKFEPRFDLMKKDAKIAHFLYGAPFKGKGWIFFSSFYCSFLAIQACIMCLKAYFNFSAVLIFSSCRTLQFWVSKWRDLCCWKSVFLSSWLQVKCFPLILASGETPASGPHGFR